MYGNYDVIITCLQLLQRKTVLNFPFIFSLENFQKDTKM